MPSHFIIPNPVRLLLTPHAGMAKVESAEFGPE
jgi:hypothetical protein